MWTKKLFSYLYVKIHNLVLKNQTENPVIRNGNNFINFSQEWHFNWSNIPNLRKSKDRKLVRAQIGDRNRLQKVDSIQYSLVYFIRHVCQVVSVAFGEGFVYTCEIKTLILNKSMCVKVSMTVRESEHV